MSRNKPERIVWAPEFGHHRLGLEYLNMPQSGPEVELVVLIVDDGERSVGFLSARVTPR